MIEFDGLCKKKEYTVTLELAYETKEYNLPGRAGYVYNYLEDAEISLKGMKYVVTGIKGEVWAIPADIESRYEIISENDKGVFLAKTKPDTTMYEYKLVPACEKTEVVLSNGSILKVNSKKSEHGEGDRLLRVKGSENVWVVNGTLFEETYEVIDG